VQKGSDVRKADYPIDSLFLDRWSPRAMSGEPLAESELMTLFEAARWAPSASNFQPWRIFYAMRDTAEWPVFFGLLKESNQVWCRNAAALLVFASVSINPKTGTPLKTHSYDTGSAWVSVALQGWLKGLVVHGMAGFDYEAARQRLNIPGDWTVEAMAAIGRPGQVEDLPENLRAREVPSTRHPLAALVCRGPWKETV
jgi:nitroreductase